MYMYQNLQELLDMILVIGFMLKNTEYKTFCIEQTVYLERTLVK